MQRRYSPEGCTVLIVAKHTTKRSGGSFLVLGFSLLKINVQRTFI